MKEQEFKRLVVERLVEKGHYASGEVFIHGHNYIYEVAKHTSACKIAEFVVITKYHASELWADTFGMTFKRKRRKK